MSSSDCFDIDQCQAAIEGRQVPETLESTWHRRATIRGIRSSLEFATSPSVTALCSGNEDQGAAFCRARNAMLIMSNMIPNLENPSHQPYCIWYPGFAREDTYREIARRYPSMRYQVGRSCAAAGYTTLYKELDLLPDVSIAEESRESGQDSEIYQIILSAPQRYAVMNDFTRSVDMDTPGTPAFLNGDMKPRWALSQRLPPPKDIPNTTADDIDIEEDGFIGIEEIEVDEARQQLGPEEAKLLWMPLPLDLPIFEKDIITQMAAYEGNVDRYVRLMHPRRLRTDYEFYSILRGIYHNTMFARWWADQLETHPERVIRPGSTPADDNKRDCDLIRTAINARRIMTNDISGLTDDPNCRPWLIWWPLLPHHNTLSALAEKCPSMRPQIAIACILSNDQVLYERLNLRPRESLLQVARRSENPFYLEDLNKRAAEQGLEFEYLGPKEEIGRSLELNLEPSIDVVFDRIQRGDMDDDYEEAGVYGSIQPRSGTVERYVWLSNETLRLIKEECDGYYQGSDTDPLYVQPDEETSSSK